MPRFSIRNPYFIVVICLALVLLGVLGVLRMPVDLFPPINIPQVVVATFYSGMPPQDIETDITDPLERFFTLASGVDHFESRSLLGVSMIKITFQPGTSADADVTQISNLALADLKRLPPGTLPPVVLKFDASSLPGLPGHRERRGSERNATPRPGAVPDPQPDSRSGERRGDSAAVRRQVPPDDGLRGPLQAGGAPAEPHGRGQRRELGQPDPSGGRREDGAVRLFRLLQQPGGATSTI